jgi:tetratricopeptide (TPR) repeat protein
MIDKSAITKAALKFTAKGQVDKAIAEWEKLLKESRDGNIYNIVGDLYLKKGAEREAVEAFTKAASIFREDGFYLKAMALYKKILNISPAEVEVLVSFAELNAGKDFIGVANDNFLAAAEIYIKKGATEKALELYKKILKLNRDNIELRTKIAELYVKIGLKEEAIKEYHSIASRYLENGEHEKARDSYNRILSFDSQDVASFIGLSKIAENDGNIEEAYEYLNKTMPFAMDNKAFLFEYSSLAIKTNNIDNAKQALTKLIESDPSNNQYRKLLGSIYLQEGLLEKAWEEMLPYIDETLHVRDESMTGKWGEVLELLENFKEIDPVAVKHRLITIYRKKGDREALISGLRELAGVFDSEGAFRDALQLYKELLELNPHDEAARGRIKEIEKSSVISSAKVRPESFEEKLIEADFYAQQGLKDEAIKLYEKLLSISPDNEELIRRLKALRLSEEEEVSKVKVVHSEEEIPASTTESDLMDVFHKFKKDVDEKLGEKDYETHYNLGIAYKEMGLLDDAVKEFQIAAKDPERTVQSSSMLALCYMEKKLYPLAIEEFKKVIGAMTPADDDYLGVKFDLAEAYEKNKKYDNALKMYTEIYVRDPKFRDVELKMENVKALIAEETKDKPKKDRISYL